MRYTVRGTKLLVLRGLKLLVLRGLKLLVLRGLKLFVHLRAQVADEHGVFAKKRAQHTPAYVSIRQHTSAYLRAEVADEDALFAKKNAQPSGIDPDYVAQHEVGMCRVRPQESVGAYTSPHTVVA